MNLTNDLPDGARFVTVMRIDYGAIAAATDANPVHWAVVAD